eukprot:TRINITY_DN1903_c1_g1_i1.p1 TRINITY_DN1903_c1_g1~~TRINITY_DN1903_c1_g1_i1.p1  ORF type:complete len:416 (-),score=120.56 TRINITY_DN1903_c1_g1_i1:88-1335(-)
MSHSRSRSLGHHNAIASSSSVVAMDAAAAVDAAARGSGAEVLAVSSSASPRSHSPVAPVAATRQRSSSMTLSAMSDATPVSPRSMRQSGGETALHIACRTGNTDMLKVLLQFNPELDTRDTQGRTPFHVACSHVATVTGIYATPATSLLSSSTAAASVTSSSVPPSPAPSKRGRASMSLTSSGYVYEEWEINDPDDDDDDDDEDDGAGTGSGCNTFDGKGYANNETAAKSPERAFEMLELLQASGATTTKLTSEPSGRTAWHVAAQNASLALCRVLASTYCPLDINVADRQGNTPVHVLANLIKQQHQMHASDRSERSKRRSTVASPNLSPTVPRPVLSSATSSYSNSPNSSLPSTPSTSPSNTSSSSSSSTTSSSSTSSSSSSSPSFSSPPFFYPPPSHSLGDRTLLYQFPPHL